MCVRQLGSILLLIVGSIALLAQEQSELPQFRAGVELIQLDVAVLDDKRQPVRGLTASDFTVLDNGVATPLRAFTPVELPPRVRTTEAVWASEAPADVVTNAVGGQDGRLVIILMDRSVPVEEPSLTARRIAAAAIDALGPQDLGAVVSTQNGAVNDATIQNFTTDRARLLRAINAANPSTDISAEAKAIWEKAGVKRDPRSDGRCLCGLCVLETITRVADAVHSTPRRRKLLLFIGSNMIWQSMRSTSERNADPGCETPLKDARAALFAAVDRANLTVHSIDPRGLVNIGPQTQGYSLNGEDRPNKPAQVARLEQQQAEMNDFLASQQNIRQLPDRTGGRTVMGRNNPQETVPEIFRESEAYYVLGIERAKTDRPDAVRPIEVKVARKGVRVYAQRLHQPPAQETLSAAAPPATPQAALARLLPNATLPLSLAVAAVAGANGSKALVRANIDAAAFARTDGTPVPLDVVIMANDRTGKPVASARQQSTISVAGLAPDRPHRRRRRADCFVAARVSEHRSRSIRALHAPTRSYRLRCGHRFSMRKATRRAISR
jgi:VWFA-related protein